jgi:hypothetical protein
VEIGVLAAEIENFFVACRIAGDLTNNRSEREDQPDEKDLADDNEDQADETGDKHASSLLYKEV